MSTNPFDMDDLLGAYALDAVDDDERRAVEDYLAANPRARAEVQEHREVATMLAWSGMDAPEGLWDRIVGSLDAHEERPDASSLGKVLPLASPRRRRAARTIGYWVAATAAAAIIAIVAVSALRTNDPATLDKVSAQAFANPALLHSQLSSGSNSSLKVLAVIDRNGTGYLRADSLPMLADQRTYQLWGLVGDKLISLGLLGSNPQTVVFTVRDKVTKLAITDEQPGGVLSSQNLPVVIGAVT